MIWLKFDKQFFMINEDIYIGITYVAPENSNAHNMYNVDIFKTIQDDVTFFQNKGHVFLLGDLNSRTSIKSDYIENDRLIPSRDFENEADLPMPRFSMDRGTNRFGEYLLEMCKAVNMRIVNGRIHKDHSIGRMTCFTHNGESVVDYVLTTQSNFKLISDFEIGDFTEYSNHAPISLSLKVHTNISFNNAQEHISFKWDSEYRQSFLNDISRDLPILNRVVTDGIDRNVEPDEIVSKFSQFITDRANPYFQKKYKKSANPSFVNIHTKEKQKWYNSECTRKHNIYKNALYNFNLLRNNETRKLMLDAKKDYKYYCRSCKLKYKYEQGKKMNEMRRKRPRDFWKLFKNNTKSDTGEVISLNEFYQYFHSLSSEDMPFENNEVNDFLQNFDASDGETSTYFELDEQITQAEIRNASKRLNLNKACSLDTILNEYLKESIDIILDPLEKLFNFILDKKSFPTQWTKGVIIPIHKKGDSSIPSNYRGITLVSCFGKLFTIIVNERLKKWALQNDIISDAQFGFKADYSTVDAIFILESFISKMIRDKKKLYCVFVDLKRAFDSIYRNGLWFKMINSGIDGKLFQLIRSIYLDIKSCVKSMNSLSDFFSSNIGLLQGEVLSPFLFSLFINDLEIYLQQNTNAGLTLDQLSIYLLMFADDAVIFSDSVDGLQSCLNSLESYCLKWNLTVNVDKTKIVVYRKGGNLSRNEKWTYCGQEIEIVSSFNYLGMVLSSGGSFNKAISTLAGKALKAMNGLLSITKHMCVPINIMLNLFDTFVASILNYSCEIWGFSRAENIERVHRKFCKWLINVKMSTNNLSLYGELGRYPLFIGRQIRIIKYWLNLHSTKNENCILRAVNCMLRDEALQNPNISNWSTKVKHLLEHSGFQDVWLFPESVIVNKFIPLLKCRLRDLYIAEWNQGVELSTSLTIYRELKKHQFTISNFLLIVKNANFRNAIVKLRLSSHHLNIEIGRHRNIDRAERKCILCNLNDLEDEYHFTLVCPIYNDLRKQYIQKYFYVRPSVAKFISLLNSNKLNTLNNLAMYVIKAFKLRENLLNQNT